MRTFSHFACFDWSGQNVERPKGIALATLASKSTAVPSLVTQANGWSRQAALDWLLQQADTQSDVLIGLDLSAGFPFSDYDSYFPGWLRSPRDAKALWSSVDMLCADDDHLAANSFIAHSMLYPHFRHTGHLGRHYGDDKAGRLRRVEIASREQGLANPYSCLNLVGAAQVGKSSLTGMRVLHRLNGRIPVWPFDAMAATGPVIVEIYTSIAARAAGLAKGRSKVRDADALHKALAKLRCAPPAPLARYDDHSTDALITAAWLRDASADAALWHPKTMTRDIADKEGWTFGVF